MSKFLYPIFKLPNEYDEENETVPTWIKWWLLNNYNKKHSWVLSEIITGNPLLLANSVKTKFYLPPLPEGNSKQDTAILPTGYTQLDYIESTGTQRIDTGITVDNTIEFDITFNTLDNFSATNNNYGCIFGSRQSSGVNDFQLTTYTASGNPTWTGTFRHGGSAGNNAYLLNNTKINVKLQDDKYYVDGEEKQTITNNASNDYNIFIFALNTGGNAGQHGKLKLYKFRLWKNGSLVRSFVPCKNASDEVGLYDTLSKTFFGNSGTGAFTAGDVATLPNPDFEVPIQNVTGDVEVVVSNADDTETQTFTFPLGTQRMYLGDYLADDGIHHVRKQVVFDGTERWVLYNTSSGLNQITYVVSNPPKYEGTSARANDLMCSHFTPINYSSYWTKENSILFAVNDTLSIQTTMSLNEFKAYLVQQNTNGSPLTVEYELAEEEITPYTEPQQQAYNEIKQAKSYKDQTNISGTSDESKPIFEVQYYMKNESEGE